MKRAFYSFDLTASTLRIIDKGGRMTVTNDMEDVLRDIHLKSCRDLSNLDIQYKDSEGNWDPVKATNYGSLQDPSYSVDFFPDQPSELRDNYCS